MHNSFILQHYVCYIIILDMFRALTCPYSGGQIVLSQHLVSSLCKQRYSMPVESGLHRQKNIKLLMMCWAHAVIL